LLECDGDHTLRGEGGEKDCAPYRCVAEGCLSTCTSSADCVADHACTAEGRCEPRSAPEAAADGGCGCRTSGSSAPGAASVLGLLLWFARRRSRLRRS
jgi:MYXO-CTERM domain-containing protein